VDFSLYRRAKKCSRQGFVVLSVGEIPFPYIGGILSTDESMTNVYKKTPNGENILGVQ